MNEKGNEKRGRRPVGLADERGVALTEFALVLPVLVLVIAGMLSFGLLFFYWLDANRLAGETARWAVVDRNPFDADQLPPNSPTLQQHVIDDVPAGMKSGLSVCIDFPDGTPEIGNRVRVRIEKPYSFVPILGIGDVTISASATMRIERFADGVAPTAYGQDDNLGACPP